MRAAASEPTTLFVGVDPVADRLYATATSAARKRQANVLFAVASLESLPEDLEGLATRLTVMLPWGSLLRAVALPDSTLLANARRVCRSGATLEVVFSGSSRDAKELGRLGLPQLDPRCREAALIRGYAEAGFDPCTIEELSMADLRNTGTTWAKRLARDGDRQVWQLKARAL